jgi:hypothetical protein
VPSPSTDIHNNQPFKPVMVTMSRRKGGRKGDDMTAGDGQQMLKTNNGWLTKDDRRWTMDDGRWRTTTTKTTIKQCMGDGQGRRW